MVTCVITTFNRSVDILKEALNSILNQSYQKIEIIIIDDNCDSHLSDQISLFLKSINCPKIKYYKNYKNLGAQYSRNRALSYAKGDYISFLDDDDEWLPEKLSEQLKLFRLNPKAGMVYCDYKILQLPSKNQKIVRTLSPKKPLEDIFFENFIGSMSFPLIKTSVLRKVGGFDLNLQASQDLDLWIRIINNSKIVKSDKILALYKNHQENQISKNQMFKFKSREYINLKYQDIISKNKKIRLYRQLVLLRTFKQKNSMLRLYIEWTKTFISHPFSLKVYKTFKILFIKS